MDPIRRSTGDLEAGIRLVDAQDLEVKTLLRFNSHAPQELIRYVLKWRAHKLRLVPTVGQGLLPKLIA